MDKLEKRSLTQIVSDSAALATPTLKYARALVFWPAARYEAEVFRGGPELASPQTFEPRFQSLIETGIAWFHVHVRGVMGDDLIVAIDLPFDECSSAAGEMPPTPTSSFVWKGPDSGRVAGITAEAFSARAVQDFRALRG